MFRTVKRLIDWTGNYKKRVYIGFIFAFLNGIFTALPIMLASYGLNAILNDFSGKEPLDHTLIWKLLFSVIVCVLLRFVFSYLRAITQESVGYEATAEQRIKLGNLFKKVSLGFFNHNNIGELSSAATTDLSFIEMYCMHMIDIVVNGHITVVVMIISLTIFCPVAGVISLIGLLISTCIMYALEKISHRNAVLHQKAQDEIVENTIEYLRGMQVVKAFKQEGAAVEGIRNAFQNHKKVNIKLELEYCPYNCLHQLILKTTSIGVVIASAYLTLNGSMPIFVMLMLDMFSFVLFNHLEKVNSAIHVIEVINATLNKLDSIQKAEEIDKNGKDISLDAYDIEFQNVSFAYDKKTVLSDVSFTLPQGATTAIVGPSGSGKTTICNLIARFYDVNKGSIRIDGHNIKEMTCESILRNISMVFQKVYLFNDTIANNIKFGNPDATYEDIIAAAKKARCHEFIEAFPNGYETIVEEGGANLSGGEKQRISIARAILKNSPIIILDEATASIDTENEHMIQQAITELTKGKTVIVIAHRLATIENADQILVIDKGKVVQKGTHQELIKQEGLYQRFISIREQAEGWSFA